MNTTLNVVWDACQAHLTEYRGKMVGWWNDCTCYSFYPSKNMTTMEGGIVCTNSPADRDTIRLLRSHGQTEKYYHPMLGYNLRMTEVAAAIGIEQLKKLDSMIERRRRNARDTKIRPIWPEGPAACGAAGPCYVVVHGELVMSGRNQASLFFLSKRVGDRGLYRLGRRGHSTFFADEDACPLYLIRLAR